MNNFSDLLFSLPDEIKFHGGHNENKKQVLIRAGKLNILYENAGLRYISAGNIEIIRRIYPAVRDKSWHSIRQSVEDEHLISSDKSFRIKTKCRCRSEEIAIQGENDSLWPLVFPAVKGMIFPVFHVFRFLLGNKNLRVIKSRSSKPLLTDCLALSDGMQARIVLVNFSGSVQALKFECCSGLFRIRSLDVSSYIDACSDFRWIGTENEKIIKSQNMFDIEPYSINFIEGWVKH